MSMTGAIGMDVQASRTALALLEASPYSVTSAPVGDGQRSLIPHAYTAHAWGSRAAQAILAEYAGDEAGLAAQLFRWQRSPWDAEFLRGVRARLDDYTGRTPLSPHTYQVALCADPHSLYSQDLSATPPGAVAPDVGDLDVLARCEAAGLAGVQLVSPVDALVCRWMSHSPAALPRAAVLLAVACGEATTTMRCYTADHSGQSPVLRGGTQATVPLGSGGWTVTLAREVLSRCRPGVPATALLALLDGAAEFGAALRAQGTRPVQWAGPLSEYLFAPLRAAAADLAAQAEVADFTHALRAEASRVLGAPGTGRNPAVILVGGPGAAWPFAGAALSGLGPVWQSIEPELDLAVGACWWTQLRSAFGGAASGLFRLPTAAPVPDPLSGWAGDGGVAFPEVQDEDGPEEGPALGLDALPLPELPADWTELTPMSGAGFIGGGLFDGYPVEGAELSDDEPAEAGEPVDGAADESFVEDIMRNIRKGPGSSPWER
jgi:hypothetical protein